MAKATIELPVDLIETYERLAIRERRPREELMREALTRYADARAAGMPSWAGIVDDPGLSSEDVDDYLAKHWKPA